MPEPAVPYATWAAAQLRAGADPESIDAGRLSGIHLEWLGVCRTANGADRRTVFDNFVHGHPQGKQFVAEVFAVQPGTAEPVHDVPPERIMVDVPPLPRAASLTAAMARQAGDTGEYLDVFAAYIHQIANTLPRDFTQAAALYTLSLAVARRLHVSTYFEGEIYPCLWILWVAESTVFHKTTGLNQVLRLARSTMDHLLLPDESSRDRLIHDMAGKPPANMDQLTLWEKQRIDRGRLHAGQRGIVLDEVSSLFSGFRKDYNAGSVEVFLKAYDCEPEKTYSTLKHGNLYVRFMYMPILGGTTPAAIQRSGDLYMWQNGFWPRFTPLVPEVVFPEKLKHNDDIITRPESIDRTLRGLLERLPEPQIGLNEPIPPKSIHVPIDKGAWKHWQEYADAMLYHLQHPDMTDDDRMRKLYGRLPTKLLQVATLLAALDWPAGAEQPRIEMRHYARAHQIVEAWRVNAHRFVAIMDRPLAGQDNERRLLNTISQLAKQETLPTTRELHRALHWPREKIESLLSQMERDGLIEAAQTDSKRTKFWKVSEEGSK